MADWPGCDGAEAVWMDKHRPWEFAAHFWGAGQAAAHSRVTLCSVAEVPSGLYLVKCQGV